MSNKNDARYKTRQQFANTIDKNLNKYFNQLAKDTKIPKSKLLDEAIELLLESRGVTIENVGENDK